MKEPDSTTTLLRREAAAESFEVRSRLRLSQRDFKLFLVSLDSDEEPNDKLRALFQDNKELTDR